MGKQWSNARSSILCPFCFGSSLCVQVQVKSLHFIVNIVYISIIFKGNRKMGIRRSMRHFNQGPLYPWPPTTVPLFSTSRQHNIHNRNPKLSVIHVLRFQEFFWLFSIYEYFSKIAMHVDYQTITGHDIIRKNTKHRNDREDTLTMDLWNAFIEAIDKKAQSLSGKSRMILITSTMNIWPVCVCAFLHWLFNKTSQPCLRF